MKRVVIEDDLMMVLDDDNLGYDAEEITTLAAARATLSRWRREHGINVAEARRTLRRYLRACCR